MEPLEFSRMMPENCTVCRNPTRYWYTPHIPLCQNCALTYDPLAKTAGREAKYLERVESFLRDD
jgi:hypothetical protein